MPKPRKPFALHVVEATVHPTKHAGRDQAPEPKGKLIKPKSLSRKSISRLKELIATCTSDRELPQLKSQFDIAVRAAKIWAEDSAIAFWLTDADSRAFTEWCRMSAEIEVCPVDSAFRAQWRMLGAEMGFLCASRSKLGVAVQGKEKKKNKFYA